MSVVDWTPDAVVRDACAVDGLSDFGAVRSADFSFAIRDSKLADSCKKEGIDYKEISDFQEVIDYLMGVTSGTSPNQQI